MMISPEGFKKDNENKSLRDLIITRNELISYMQEFENRKILSDNKISIEDDYAKPSPSTVYYCYNLYLKEITDLIVNKRREFEEV